MDAHAEVNCYANVNKATSLKPGFFRGIPYRKGNYVKMLFVDFGYYLK